jgi:hypothetical protein
MSHRRLESLHKHVRINERVEEILVSERKNGERFIDTIFRIIMEKGELAIENNKLTGLIYDSKFFPYELASPKTYN